MTNEALETTMVKMIASLSVWARHFREWLQNPLSVLFVACILSIGAVLVDGTLFRLWSLARDRDQLESQLTDLKSSIIEKERRLDESNRPEFIERQQR
jgi:hypothetical protein